MPHTFIKKQPKAIKRLRDMTKEQSEHFKKDHNLLKGDESESAFFSSLVTIFRQEKYRKNRIFIFNGVEFLYPGREVPQFESETQKMIHDLQGLIGEFDTVIIDESKKLITYVELKYTFSRNHSIKKDQFVRFKKLLDNHMPVGKGWRLATAYGFSMWPKDNEDGTPSKKPCQRCSKNVFMVDDVEKIQTWYDSLGSDDSHEGVDTLGKCQFGIALTKTDCQLSSN